MPGGQDVVCTEMSSCGGMEDTCTITELGHEGSEDNCEDE